MENRLFNRGHGAGYRNDKKETRVTALYLQIVRRRDGTRKEIPLRVPRCVLD